MTDLILKIIKPISDIDGGCPACVSRFLLNLYRIESFNIELVCAALKGLDDSLADYVLEDLTEEVQE